MNCFLVLFFDFLRDFSLPLFLIFEYQVFTVKFTRKKKQKNWWKQSEKTHNKKWGSSCCFTGNMNPMYFSKWTKKEKQNGGEKLDPHVVSVESYKLNIRISYSKTLFTFGSFLSKLECRILRRHSLLLLVVWNLEFCWFCFFTHFFLSFFVNWKEFYYYYVFCIHIKWQNNNKIENNTLRYEWSDHSIRKSLERFSS